MDAQLVPFGPIDTISASLNQVNQSLRQFESNPGNRSILDQAESQAQGILSYLAQLPEASATGVEDLREIGGRYRRSMSAQVGQLSGEVATLGSTIQELGEAATARRTELAGEIGRLDAAIIATGTAFETAQTERNDTFTKQLAELTGKLESALTEGSEALEAATTAARESASNALDDLTERSATAWAEIAALRERAETASNYLGINALAGGYHASADVEEGRSFWLRLGAIACFLGAIGASVFALIYHTVNAFSLEGFLTKAGVAIPFLLLAGYLARESSRHGERGHVNRQRQRQLESLPAYADGLDASQRTVLYEALAPGFFSPVAIGTREKAGGSGGDPMTAAMSLLLEASKKQPAA